MSATHLEVLVEEPSMAAAMSHLLPKIVPGTYFEVRTFRGKADLLAKLSSRLKGYMNWATAAGLAIVVVVDRDDDSCVDLKKRVDDSLQEAGLTPCSVSTGVVGGGICRLAIEELEAWFLGDVQALVKAYPRVPVTLSERSRFRNPDGVRGGTWEALEYVLQGAGYHLGGLRKLAAAHDVATHMDVESNTSRSFQKFREGIRFLVYGDPYAAA